MNLLKNIKLTRVMNDVVAGTTEQKSSVIDMQGYDGVIFVLLVGDITSTCVLTATVNQNTANSTSSPSPTAIANAVVGPITAGASDNDNGVYVIDVYRPVDRYVFLDITRTTANAVIDGVIAIQYCGIHKPTTQDATTILKSVFAVGS